MDRIIEKHDKSKIIFKKTILSLNTPFPISKIGSIFIIGDCTIDKTVIDIINLGLKFTPSFTKFDLYYFLFNFYVSLNTLNNFCTFKLYSKNKKDTTTTTVTEPSQVDSASQGNGNYKSFFQINQKSKAKDTLKSPLLFTKNFRINFLTNILSKIDISPNNFLLNFQSFKSTFHKLRDNDLKVINADKNVGTVIIDNQIYTKLCFDHLDDKNTYKMINYNPQFELFNTTKNLLLKLKNNNHISDKLYNCFNSNINFKKLASFRILAKLHKEAKFGVRPLVNCANTTLSIISKFLDFTLKPFINTHFSYIKDSQNLMQKLDNFKCDSNTSLFSADFESLYTNIPLDEAIEIISDFISNVPNTEFSGYGFNKLLELVLKNNFFYFKFNKLQKFYLAFFLQISGVSMGTSCGPSVANSYLQFFEIKYKNVLERNLYFRFIDDLLFSDKYLLDNFKNIFPKLNLTISSGKTVQFLDLNVSIGQDYKFNLDLFIKKTNTFAYLDSRSNHTLQVFRGVIITLVHRIRKICTDFHRFYYHCNLLFTRLLAKGYSSSLIQNIIRSFSKTDRYSLLTYKVKENSDLFTTSLFFITTFDKRIFNSSQIYKNVWDNSINNDSFLKQFIFRTIYKNNTSFNSYYVNNFFIPCSSNSFNICTNDNCTVCKYANTNIKLDNTFNLPILIPTKSFCSSINCIYILKCNKCEKFYVGETSRSAKVRIKEHLNKIKYFIKLSVNNELFEDKMSTHKDTEILYRHFAVNHNLETDFSFQIFLTNVLYYRLRLENDLILILNTRSPLGLNTMSNLNLYNFESYKK